jgi:hypothetical protein
MILWFNITLTLHCYKQQDNEDMRNISSETSE